MILSNLEVNKTVKNYKELCSLLGIKQEAGNSKKAQLKEIERYVKYIKIGNSFLIKEIYKTPAKKVDKRSNNKGGNNIKYNEYIEILIKDLCNKALKDDFNYIEISTTQLLKELGMINKNYKVGKNNMDLFSLYLHEDQSIIKDFYNTTFNNLKTNLERALNNLQSKNKLKWEYVLRIKTKGGTYRKATENEVYIIAECEEEILNKLKCKNKVDLFKTDKWKEFDRMMKDLLTDTAIDYYFNSFYIVILNMKTKYTKKKIKDTKETLNNKLVENFILNAETRHINIKKRYTKKYLLNEEVFTPGILFYKNRIQTTYKDKVKLITSICISLTSNIDLESEFKSIKINFKK